MRTLLVSCACLMLSACSGDANPFSAKTPEELAVYLAFGLEDGTVEVSERNNLTLTTKVVNANPLTMVMTAKVGEQEREAVRVITRYTDKCVATFETNPDDDEKQLVWKMTTVLGLQNLTAAKLVSNGRTIRLEGTARCVLSERDQCNDVKDNPWEFDWLRSQDTEASIEAEQKRLDMAVKQFREKVCSQ